MKRSYKNSLYRINTILTLFRSVDVQYSVKSIAEMLDVPVKIIRQDLCALISSEECETVICPYEEDAAEDDKFLERLKKGLEDDRLLCAYSKYNADIVLPLTEMEMTVLESVMPDWGISKGYANGNVFLKADSSRESFQTQMMISKLNEYIRNQNVIECSYVARNGHHYKKIIKPLLIARYFAENVSYLITIEKGKMSSIRIDRIKEVKKSNKKIEIKDLSPLKNLPVMWKMDAFDRMDVVLKIKGSKYLRDIVKEELMENRIIINEKISEEYRSVFEKADRGSWEDCADYAIYKGTIIGRDAFRNWINGFGDSIIVLEPVNLRDEIIENAKRRLSNYN